MTTRREQVEMVLNQLGGSARLSQIYHGIAEISGYPLSSGQEASVRKAIESHSSDSQNWDGRRPDLFRSVHGIGGGVWALR